MKYDYHPTWKILEKTKIKIKNLQNLIPQDHLRREFELLEQAHNSIVKLQLELENKLCQEM